MKIVVTIADAVMAANVGGPVEQESAIIDIPDDKVPKIVRDYFAEKHECRKSESRHFYKSMAFSLLNVE